MLLAMLALLIGSGVVYQLHGSWHDRRHYLPPGKLVPVNGHALHLWVDENEPPTVVLEAGIGASSISWQLVHHEVAHFARVCAYDRAGLGWSSAAPPPRTGARLVAELRGALAGARLTPPHILVGHSFGAYVVRLFAALHPSEVAGLVLVDPLDPEEWAEPTASARRRLRGGVFCARVGAGLAAVGVVRLAVNRFLAGDQRTSRAVLGAFPREATPVVEGLVGQIAKLPATWWPAIRAHWTRTKSLWILAQYLRAIPGCAKEVIAAEATHQQWKIPVVVLSAATASERSRGRDRLTAARSVDGEHHAVPSSGHWLQLDTPQAVVDAIRAVVLRASQRQLREREADAHDGARQ